jgi:hypothetical protein
MRLVAGKRCRIGTFADRNDKHRLDDDEPATLLPSPVTVAQLGHRLAGCLQFIQQRKASRRW